jgi:ferredoxin
VIFEEDLFNSLPEACEEEEDMLDLAFGLTPTSRLGCQVKYLSANQQIVIKV